jgi:hypothetical protein
MHEKQSSPSGIVRDGKFTSSAEIVQIFAEIAEVERGCKSSTSSPPVMVDGAKGNAHDEMVFCLFSEIEERDLLQKVAILFPGSLKGVREVFDSVP